MLKRLDIENLVLIKKAHVQFDSGFTIITGETGSGKTILLQALKYVTGERADAETVRTNALKAVIEAEFDLIDRLPIENCLEEAGIEWEPGTPLLLKREISKEGRNRAFINCQMVTLSLLQNVGEQLIDFTDQHAHHQLHKASMQRLLLDLFGNLSSIVQEAKQARENFLEIETRLIKLKQQAEAKDRELDKIKNALEELGSANIRPKEDETISSEHHRLAHAQELTGKTGQLLQLLENPPFALIAQNKKMHVLIQQITTIDPSLQDLLTICQEISVNLQEIHSSLTSYLSKIDANPKRLGYLEERLSLIEKLKRKYGDPIAYLEELKLKELKLSSFEEEIEILNAKRMGAEKFAMTLAEKRFASRKQAALFLSEKITDVLRTLNMAFAKFSVELSFGFADDGISFHLQANPGQPGGAIQECASGGELSRLMIALRAVMAEKHPTPTIIFDEIDANIGGETATMIGETFLELGKSRQVLAITHFPQVAKLANHHLKIGKQLNESDALATIETLKKDERSKELLRMLGRRQAIPQE